MNVKISLTVSKDVLAALDRIAGPGVSRSSFIERVLRDFVEQREQARRLALNVSAINRHAASLNAEVSDSLSFQVGMNKSRGAATEFE